MSDLPKLHEYKDYEPYSTGKGQAYLIENGGCASGNYTGPEGVVLIYTSDPNPNTRWSNGWTRMEYIHNGKVYTRTWRREINQRYLARMARNFIRSVQDA